MANRWPFTIESGRIWGCANKTEGWNLHEGSGSREWKKKVAFSKPFTSTPAVVVSFALLDFVNCDDDFRCNAEPINITNTGFELKVSTWLDTEVWSVAVTWIAYDTAAAAKQGSMIHSGRINFKKGMDGYTLHENEGSRAIQQHVVFPDKFWTTPTVITGLCLVDILNDADCRIAVSPENVNSAGFDCKLSTWSDTHVWGASVAWIAFDGALFRSGGGQIQAGKYKFTQNHPAYTLHQGEGTRSISHHELYQRQFTTKPTVVVMLSSLDAVASDDELDIRVSVEAENCTPQGFELKLATWRDSRIWSAQLSWVAYGDSPAPMGLAAAVAPANPANDDDDAKLESPAKKQKASESKEEEQIAEERECKICYDASINTVVIPCGHMCVCDDCANLLRNQAQKLCPICKQPFTSIIKTFIA